MGGCGDQSKLSESQKFRDFVCHAGAGGAAGAIAATFVCPLDVIKTRLQVYGIPSGHKGSIIVASLRDIIKTEGLRGMYRGLSPTIVALLPNWAVYFTVYDRLKRVLHTHVDENNQLTIGANMVAAAGAGAATAITTNPFWVVKTRLQTQALRPDVVPYNGVLSAIRRILHEEGYRGLYRGVVPSLAGISHVAIQFPAYERAKSYLARKERTTVDKLSPASVSVAASICKVIASVLTYPHEVVRSRLQEQGQARNNEVRYAGVMDCVKKVYQQEGLPGFYRGCATNLLRTTPSAVITFTSYEMIHRFLQKAIPSSDSHSIEYRKVDGDTNNRPGSGQSQSQLNERTSPIPLGNKEQLTRH